MLLPSTQQMLPRQHRLKEVNMNIDNRRLREVQSEIRAYHHLLKETDSISESLIYQGKIEALEREEKDILKRYDVEV